MSEKNKNIPKLCSCINSNDGYIDIDIYYNIEEDKVIKFYFVYPLFKNWIKNIDEFPCMAVDTCKQQCKILDGCLFEKIKKTISNSASLNKEYIAANESSTKKEIEKIKEAIDCINVDVLGKNARIFNNKAKEIVNIINDNKERLDKEFQEKIDKIFKKYYLFGLTCLGDISKEDKQNSCCGCFYF